jgi:hypothetical protein
MNKRKTLDADGECCLCGLPYELGGNNPAPLATEGRCCEPCAEVVTSARLTPRDFLAGFVRAHEAVTRMRTKGDRVIAMAVICAWSGPPLMIEKKALLARMMEVLGPVALAQAETDAKTSEKENPAPKSSAGNGPGNV